MKAVFSEAYLSRKEQILDLLLGFESGGTPVGPGKRNKIKIFELGEQRINVKRFRVPNAINRISYALLRKSKAQRSYEYAHRLLEKGIGTPEPIGYAEEIGSRGFGRSFYISEHLDCNLSFRELLQNPDFPQREKLLVEFTRFTYELHEKEVEFLDHSPGNTLIELGPGASSFYLVDLNRMNFGPLNFEARMRNFSRLSTSREIIKSMAQEYARLSGKPESLVFERMWHHTREFQKKFQGKRELKKKLKFWKTH